jgi:siderophore synthetase component
MTSPDPLALAADLAADAHRNAVLRCWTRETGTPVALGPLRISLPAATVTATVTHASAVGWHQFTDVMLEHPERRTPSPDELVRLFAESIAADPSEIEDLVSRTAESTHNLTFFLTHLPSLRSQGTSLPAAGASLTAQGSKARFDRSPPPQAASAPAEGASLPAAGASLTAQGSKARLGRFLDAEQALVLGHLNHPAPKSRENLSDPELAAYSPEVGGRFQVHWFAADADVVSHDHVDGSPSMRGLDTPGLMAELSGLTPEDGTVLVPAHPWQAADAIRRPRIAALIESGRLRPLGPHGVEWFPTSSLRTVYHPDMPVMMKLSLGLRITNSRRESTATELRRGLEIHRLLDAGHGSGTWSAHKRFSIVRDPAWLAVDEGTELTGLDVAVREVPPGIDDLVCLAGLVAPRPLGGRSRLGEAVAALGRGAAESWLAAYIDLVLVPMLHLYAETGIGLEAHQQNTLVRLDDAGAVIGGAYRDNQGYYLASSHASGDSTLAVVEDAIVDDRLTYYQLQNQALAVVGCLAAEGLASEPELIDVVRDRLTAALPGLAAAGPDGGRLARRWLTAERLPCKANMLTRLRGIDEVIAPLDAQSVYLEVPNPLVAGRFQVAARRSADASAGSGEAT